MSSPNSLPPSGSGVFDTDDADHSSQTTAAFMASLMSGENDLLPSEPSTSPTPVVDAPANNTGVGKVKKAKSRRKKRARKDKTPTDQLPPGLELLPSNAGPHPSPFKKLPTTPGLGPPSPSPTLTPSTFATPGRYRDLMDGNSSATNPNGGRDESYIRDHSDLSIPKTLLDDIMGDDNDDHDDDHEDHDDHDDHGGDGDSATSPPTPTPKNNDHELSRSALTSHIRKLSPEAQANPFSEHNMNAVKTSLRRKEFDLKVDTMSPSPKVSPKMKDLMRNQLSDDNLGALPTPINPDDLVANLIKEEKSNMEKNGEEFYANGDTEANGDADEAGPLIRFKEDVSKVRKSPTNARNGRMGAGKDETRLASFNSDSDSERRNTQAARSHWRVATKAAQVARMAVKPFQAATVRIRGRSASRGSGSGDFTDSEETEVDESRGGTVQWARKASAIGGFTKRKSIADISNIVKKQQEFEELKSSVGQFRNPVFDNSVSRSSGTSHTSTDSVRLRAGIYGSRRRMRRGSIAPEDIMEINRVRRKRAGKEVMDVVITPQEKRKPDNAFDWVWDCDSHTYQRWYLIQIFLIILEACILPYQFVFWEKGGTVEAPYFWTVIHFFISLFYIADLYFSFHLTYVDKKSEVVIDLDLIRAHYVGSLRFYLDVVAALPFDFVRLFTMVWWWASYVKLIKCFRLLQVMRLKRLSDNQTVVNLGRIIWVLVIFVVVMHIMACMWFQLSVYEEKILVNNHSWMRQKFQSIAESTKLLGFDELSEEEIEDMTLDDYSCGIGQGGLSLISNSDCFTQFRQYLVSLYAVMLILMQDSVDPSTEIECLFAIVFGLFGMVVGAVLVGQTADIIGNLHRAESRYRNKLDDVTEQLKNLDIDGKTRRRVFEYLDFIWTINKGLNRESILGELSENLRNEVLVSVHGEVIRKIPLFDIDEIPELLVHVVSLLKSSYYLPGDVIIHEHEKTVDTSCMYFIVHGNVAVYHMKQPEDILHMMTKGDFFGEIAYLARGARRTASLCAASNSDVASLRFTDVDYLTKLFPEMKNRMENELKKHMAFTVEGKKYLEAEMNMGKVALGSIVFHQNRGEGIVVYIDEHKRRHVQFKDGDVHKYLPTSWHKMKLLKMGESPRNVWKERENRQGSKRRGSLLGMLTPPGSGNKEGHDHSTGGQEAIEAHEGGSKKHLDALKSFAKSIIVESPAEANGDKDKRPQDGERKHGSGRKHNSFKFAARFLSHHRPSKEKRSAPSPLKLSMMKKKKDAAGQEGKEGE